MTPAELSEKYGVTLDPVAPTDTVGRAANLGSGELPLNGLRHPREGGASGWFLWAGEYSDAADFFQPVHARHLDESCPEVVPFLGLPPGWRFLVAGEHVDVWYDPALLEI